MALKGVVEREFQKIRKTARRQAVKLGFGPVKGRLAAIFLEHEWWEGQQRLSRSQVARVRCLEALDAILDPANINGTDAADWIQQIDRSVAVLRRDVANATPRGPNGSILRVFKKEQSEASKNAHREGLAEGRRMVEETMAARAVSAEAT
jgi:hypothetical protein